LQVAFKVWRQVSFVNFFE